MVRSIHLPIDHDIEPVTGSREEDDALIARYIAPRPSKQGRANAYLPGFGFRVATLIGYLKSVENDARETASFYQLPEDVMRAVIAFYRQNRAVIDARILLDDQWDETFVHRGRFSSGRRYRATVSAAPPCEGTSSTDHERGEPPRCP